ncbi:MAG: ferric uptake regulator, Fur family [Verrucomicrobia bacterium]|nr:ferric uptake regulator, Fur family [Verrucomicrobiota bacterium]
MIASTQTNHPLVGAKSAGSPQSPISIACTQLKRAGLRITQPRIAIVTTLVKRGQPTSIEQIHADLAPGSCDLVTVYRCLAAFEEIGLVRRSFYHNGTSLYTINLGDSNNYHFVCKDTNQVEEIDSSTSAEVRRCVQQIEETLKSRGYTDVTHMVEFFGRSPQANAARASTEMAPPPRTL